MVSSRALSGIFWTAVNKYSGFLIQILISAVLARLISPEEFGVVAAAQVLIVFITIFAEMGIGPAIIQNKTFGDKEIDSVFTYTIIVSVFLSGLFFLCAPIVARFYDNDQLIPICRWLALGLFFTSLSIVPSNLFYRSKEFKFIAIRNLVFQVVSGIAAIIYAYRGGGCFAIVLSSVLTSFMNLVVSLSKYPRKIDFKFNFAPLRSILSFSIYQFLFTLINFFMRNLDKMVIGRHIGMGALGYYQKSYQLMLQPLDKVTEVVGPVLQPILSDYQDQKQIIAEKYLLVIKYLAMISFPLAVILFSSASELIHFFFGDQWDAAILPFKILTFSIPLQMILSTSGSIFQSANATKQLFFVGTINSAITVVGFILATAIFHTIEAVSVAWVVCNIIAFFISYPHMYIKVLSSRFVYVLSRLKYPFCLFVILFASYCLLEYLTTDIIIVDLVIKFSFGGIVSIGFYLLTKQLDYQSIRKFLFKKQ